MQTIDDDLDRQLATHLLGDAIVPSMIRTRKVRMITAKMDKVGIDNVVRSDETEVQNRSISKAFHLHHRSVSNGTTAWVLT